MNKIACWLRGDAAFLQGWRLVLIGLLLASLLVLAALPMAFGALSYLDIDGTYTVQPMSAGYLDRSVHVAIPATTLVINNTAGAVTATWSGLGADIALTGLLGAGSYPSVSLSGTDSVGTVVSVNGKILKSGSSITGISGKVTGYITSEGKKGTDSGGTSSAAHYVGANSHGGEGYSALLNKSNGSASSTYVLFSNPTRASLKLSSLSRLVSGYDFWYYLSAAPGPQMELHFESSNGIGWVDVTVMPAQGQYAVTSAWAHVVLTSSTISCIYYGEDSIDGTPFDFAEGGHTLGEMLAMINDEAEMAGCTANNWLLTRVRFELWEAGARTCYIDDVTLGGKLYTFEPMRFDGTFSAFK